ncbi:unnamed protein product [Bursaphelenchus xylophilus]|uniref:(pine wood nematode) hypothetical protein n=1 Tax=Bursaphelenchus xylophilus TaxID=6326 RepID=A0A7I8X9I5_BURXY|nr:unnamed protein product [Bursaphelenchus xylophilus]CAG9131911.1 unnamed protein product [Bursaphelenchus xylophilus]
MFAFEGVSVEATIGEVNKQTPILEPVNDPYRNLPTVDLEAETSLESVLGSNPPIQCLEEADHWKPVVHPRRDIANDSTPTGRRCV